MGRPNFKNGNYVTNPRYREISVLDKLLTNAEIPHEMCKMNDGWQINYPSSGDEQIMDAIEHFGSYGESEDLLEIMGLTHNGDSVEGWLTAKEVFERIKIHHDGQWGALQSGVILSDREKTIMRALEAKYISRDYSSSFVKLWGTKPTLSLYGEFVNSASFNTPATVDIRFFPLVEEGTIVEFKDD